MNFTSLNSHVKVGAQTSFFDNAVADILNLLGEKIGQSYVDCCKVLVCDPHRQLFLFVNTSRHFAIDLRYQQHCNRICESPSALQPHLPLLAVLRGAAQDSKMRQAGETGWHEVCLLRFVAGFQFQVPPSSKGDMTRRLMYS